MPDDAPIPSFESLMQDMAPAFERDQSYELIPLEVEVVYLSLIRLKEIEQAVMEQLAKPLADRDWKSIGILCPPVD